MVVRAASYASGTRVCADATGTVVIAVRQGSCAVPAMQAQTRAAPSEYLDCTVSIQSVGSPETERLQNRIAHIN